MMPDSKQLSGLYAIADTKLLGANLISSTQQALQGGARLIQYRDKSNESEQRLLQAKEIRALCNEHGAFFIVNDDVELAYNCDADGVHLGKNDLNYKQARKKLSTNAIIGVSCYNQLSIAAEAAKEGANYIAFGSVYSSSIKPNAVRASLDLFQQAQALNIPLCAIGGITLKNAQATIDAGAHMLAVISALFDKTSTENTAKKFTSLF